MHIHIHMHNTCIHMHIHIHIHIHIHVHIHMHIHMHMHMHIHILSNRKRLRRSLPLALGSIAPGVTGRTSTSAKATRASMATASTCARETKMVFLSLLLKPAVDGVARSGLSTRPWKVNTRSASGTPWDSAKI